MVRFATLILAVFTWLCAGSARLCGQDLPRLVTEDGRDGLEPSGLVWDEELGKAVAVTDERHVAPGYEIFAFDPMSAAQGQIRATPLLSSDQSAAFQLDDLEGLTRTPDGTYFALASLSLDADERNPEDRWTRFQAVRFRIANASGKLRIAAIERVSAYRRPDLREWVISSSGRDWPDGAYRKRGEAGGINVEGLSSTEDGTLILGFRGPIDAGPRAPVLFLRPLGADEAPEALLWNGIPVGDLPGDPAERNRGIRAFERIPGSRRHVVLLGAESRRHDRVRIVLWDPESGAVQDRGELPERFVGEGVAVMAREGEKLQLLLVDDRRAKVLTQWVPGWVEAEDGR